MVEEEWEKRNTCKICKKVVRGDLYPHERGIFGGVKNYICKYCKDEYERICKCSHCREEFELDNKELKQLEKKGEIKVKCPYCKKTVFIEEE